MRLIDADALEVEKLIEWYGDVSQVIYKQSLDEAPTIEIPKWIPVTERLPEDRLAVLVYCPEYKNIFCAYYANYRWWNFGAFHEKIADEVVAWMPLPTPYKEGE